MNIVFNNKWDEQLRDELEAPYMKELLELLELKYRTKTVYPPKEYIFNALHYTDYDAVKVVVLGQDPYHGPNQAHGLSFSVQPSVPLPPSLRNIFKELSSDIGCALPEHGCLEAWARQGVLLLNTVLTVEEGQPNSHQKLGWERFTDAIIERLNKRERPLVFLLWGKHAEAKASRIDVTKHAVLSSAHPSPLSARRGFFGSKPFTRVNELLQGMGHEPINWALPLDVKGSVQ